MDPLKRSNLLWWGISFLTYLALSLFGYFYLIQSFSFYSILVDDQVKDLIVYGSYWTLLIGLYIATAFVLALPLLLPQKLSRWALRFYLFILTLWTGFLFLGQLQDAIMILASNPPFFIGRFLYWLLFSPAVLIFLILIPFFLRKRIILQSPFQLSMGYIFVFVLLLLTILFTTLIGYASIVADGLSGTDPSVVRSRGTLPRADELTPSEQAACEKMQRIIIWGKMWKEMYVESCPDKVTPLQRESGAGQLFSIIPDEALENAMDACLVSKIVYTERIPIGVCLTDGTAWVTDNQGLLDQLYASLPAPYYKGAVGYCDLPESLNNAYENLNGDQKITDSKIVSQLMEQNCLQKTEPLLIQPYN